VSLEAGLEPPTNPMPARTLDTVNRRLGLEIDSFLRRQPVCSECYQRFSFEEIDSAEVDKCFRPGCRGIFWHTSKGKREPVKSVVYTKLVATLRRLLLRPDFIQALSSGRNGHKDHAYGTLQDVCDGSAWSQGRTGLERIWRADGRPVDRAASGRAAETLPTVVSLGYGLQASVNIDWFGITKKYSVGAVYVCFLNLHRSVRYRPENTILACMIPGPGEPSLEELNSVLDPLVEEFQVLYAGEYIVQNIYRAPERSLYPLVGVAMKTYEDNLPKVVQVHVAVHMVNADSPARAKSTGTGGHAHHSAFCVCECSHDDINTEHGYDIDGKETLSCFETILLTQTTHLAHIYVNEDDILRLARNSQQAPNDRERERLSEEYGVRWSSFNNLPQWKPYMKAPIDMMHNLYLGTC
jgi:hypothetical protein